MLADALALGVDPKGYVTREHPVQKLVRACVEDVIGTNLTTEACGTDGCSIPTWAAPLTAFATGFARMATGEDLPEDLAAASRRIFAAVTAHPQLIRAADTIDSDAMAAFNGRLMLKVGAEGVFCGAVIDKGLGFALKIDDGSIPAAECAVANLVDRHCRTQCRRARRAREMGAKDHHQLARHRYRRDARHGRGLPDDQLTVLFSTVTVAN